MRAVVFTGSEGPDDVAVQQLDDPTPAPHEAVVTVESSALNYRDLGRLVGGAAARGDGPFVPGSDVAGIVEAVGTEVTAVAPGDRVVVFPLHACGACRYCHHGPENLCENADIVEGGFAEKVSVPADRLVVLPDGIESRDAAALPVSYVTAWRMLRLADTGPGDLVFVPGATGGVGVAAIQLTDVLGARSIGTSTSASKLRQLESVGATHTIESSDPVRLRELVARIGEPDVALNHLGGAYTDVCLRTVRRNGIVVVCGRTAGPTSEIDVREVYWQQKRIVGSTLGTQHDLERLVGFVADGRFEPVVGSEYSLEDAPTAFEALQDRDAFGKLLLRP